MNALGRLTLAAALAAATGCARYTSEPPEEKRPAIAVMHSAHGDMDCTDCHDGIDKATTLAKVQRPTSELCTQCHEGDKDKVVRPWKRPAARLTFDHAAHLKVVKGKNQAEKCGACHKKLPDPGEEVASPPMDACTSCHNHQADYAAGRCRPCHVDLRGLEPEKYFTHAGDWMRNHKAFARPSAESCSQCHDQTYCSACHSPQTAAARPSVIFPERVDASFIHRGDYVSRHAIEAGANPASCNRCHGKQYCDTCHATQNLSTSVGSAYSPHPQGWLNRGAGEKFHGEAARRDSSSCASCHDQGAQSICVSCHNVATGVGVNIHPKSWKKDQADIADNPMCRNCHNQ